MQIKFKKLHKDAVIPKKAHATDAGFDLTAVSGDIDSSIATYGTGIAVDIPKGYVGLLFPRSSISKTDLSLANSVGVIDAGYHGEIKMKFRHHEADRPGDIYGMKTRIGQLIIMPIPEIEFVEVDNFEPSERGTGGFGSSGE